MRYKKHMLLLALAIFLLGISGSWASDTNDTVTDTVDEHAIELSNDDIIAADENEDILKVNEQTFGDLNNTINGNSDRDIYLDSDYKYSEGDSAFKDGIVIDRDLNVYGNGHTINGSNQARIFKINNGNVVFHNITFTNGNASGYGGAIKGKCTAIDCTFTDNIAKWYGGAMYLGSAINCTFTDNIAKEDGGAMSYGSAINCTFTGNTADYGGAISYGSAVNCTFTNNNATDFGGAMYGGSAINCTFTTNSADYGGAMCEGSAVNCTFTGNTAESDGGAMIGGSAVNCTFTNNNATDFGGAMYGGSAINCTFTGNTAIREGGAMFRGSAINCTFTGNTAIREGGAMSYGSAVNCTFTGNTAESDGGAMSYGSAVNCTFTGNTAKWDGGAMSYGSAVNCTFTGNTAEVDGGAMEGGSAVNCTFTGNTAEVDGGAMEGGSAVNCTFTGNTADYGWAMYNSYYLNCIGPEGDYYDCHPLDLYFDVSDFTSTYKSNKGFDIILKGQKGSIDFINVDVVIYKDGVGEVMRYSCLSGDSLIFDLAAGNYTAELNITYPNLVHISKNIILTINKATPKIKVAANESTYPDDVIVNVKTDVSGEYMVTVGDKTQIVTFEANVAKDITFTGFSANETGYTVNVTNMDIENCTKMVNDTAKAILHKATPKIEVTANESTYPDVVVVNVKSDVGGIYEVKIGDKTQIVTLEANVAQNITFTGLAANETGYTVNVTHDSENYTGFNITILKIKKAAPTITATEITATYNINRDLVITLTDIQGNPMVGEKITVSLNGIKTYITDKNGQIKVTTKGLTPKTYTAAITFDGNTNYAKTSKNVKVTVNKAKAKIIAKKKTFKAKKKVKKFTITLKDNKGKGIKNAKVTLKAIKIKKTSKNKTKKTGKKNILKAKTNKKGKATFKINRKSKGKYQVIIKYKGNKYYKSVTKKVKITIK